MRDSSTIAARHVGGDRFCVRIREHKIVLDQPIDDGGTDTGPTPTELFVASLAACVGHYARRYLARHGLAEAGLRVEAKYEMSAKRPARVTEVQLRVHVPDQVPVDRLPALLAVASHCTLHHTLETPPRVDIELAIPARSGDRP
jgi:putative redox protein